MSSRKKRDLIPIHLLVKFRPPIIALHYRLKNEPNKEYVHDMPVECDNNNPEDAYQQLLVTEKPYIDDRTLSKPQVNT